MRSRLFRRISTIMVSMLICMHLYATVAQVNSKITSDSALQTIYGYIDEQFELTISEPIYGGQGFNLDIFDQNNPVRLEIAPTPTACEIPGLKIGEFSLITSYPNITLKVTHNPLTLNYTVGDEAMVEYVDWELGIIWEKNGARQVSMCLSDTWDSSSSYSSTIRSIVIPVTGTGDDVSLRNAGLFFRLTPTSPVQKIGTYLSSVVFEVNGL